MTGVYSILGFVAKLKAIEHDMNELGPAIVARACEMVAAEAKRVIGEGYEYWPALQPATLARKMMNTPLLETGELRARSNGTPPGITEKLAATTTRQCGTNSAREQFLRGLSWRGPPHIWGQRSRKWPPAPSGL